LAQVDQALVRTEAGGARTGKSAKPTSVLARLWAGQDEFILGLVALVVFVLFWEWIIQATNVSALFLAPPSRVWNAAITELFGSRGIWEDLAVSGSELGLGYLGAVAIGLPAGILLGWYRRVRATTNPFVSFLYAVPRVAFLPVIVMWFGIGLNSKIVIVFLSAVFPMLIATIAGVRSVDRDLLRCARSFGANDRQLFRTVVLPGSVPFILTGMRLAVGRALIGVVVGELYASTNGLGHYMAQAGAQYRTDRVFFAVLLFGFVGMAAMAVTERLESRFQAWRPESSA
jgi:NitT/TauT family transport system permease protein